MLYYIILHIHVYTCIYVLCSTVVLFWMKFIHYHNQCLILYLQAQYLFVHETLNEMILCGDTEIQSRNLKKVVENLYIENFGVKSTRLEKQFKVRH